MSEPVSAKTLWDIAEEETEYKKPGESVLHDWTIDNNPPAAPGPQIQVQQAQPKYTDDFFRHSGRQSAKMVAQILTLIFTAFNHWFMKWKLKRILSEEEVAALREKEEKEPAKLTIIEKLKLKNIDRILQANDKLKDDIKFKETEERDLGDSFYEYQKFTQKPLPATAMIWFNIGVKVLKIVNAYIFA